jgi:hypothetical protein
MLNPAQFTMIITVFWDMASYSLVQFGLEESATPDFGGKKEAAGASEMLISIYQITRRHISKYSNMVTTEDHKSYVILDIYDDVCVYVSVRRSHMNFVRYWIMCLLNKPTG